MPFQTVETLNKPRLKQKRLGSHKYPESYPKDWKNRLIWGDNKFIMSSLLKQGLAGKIDLIYIDPPFATGADFSVKVNIGNYEIMKEASVIEEHAYRDTWGKGLQSYLQMMYERLVLMRELLSEKGSIYVHLDYRMVHPIKLIMDEIFGRGHLINQIIWRYRRWTGSVRGFQKMHDVLLWYRKNDRFTWNEQREPYSEKTVHRSVSVDGVTKLHQDEESGVAMSDVWEISYVHSQSHKRTGFPTQKPESLLERIIKASSNAGDLVADFFCGSGTTGAVAEKLGRRWIMSDLSKFAIHTTRKRLLDIHSYSKNYDKPCRPFIVQNLGSYQKYKFIQNGHPPVERYRKFILQLYEAEPIEGYAFVHGRKAKRFVHIAGVDSVVTRSELEDAAQECANEVGGKALDVLGWDFELGLDKAVKDIEDIYGIRINLKYIPREATELKSPADAGDEIKFFDISYLKVGHNIKGNLVKVTLEDFVFANPEFIPEEIRKKLHKNGSFTDYIDYWSVDFDYKNDTFHNMWQSFRTKKSPQLDINASLSYQKEGKKKVFVKVIDIFGNDTNKVLEVDM